MNESAMQGQWRGVLFDLDGTLVDSEPLHGRAWDSVLREDDVALAEDWFSVWIGIPDWQTAIDLQREHTLPTTPEALLARKRSAFQTLVKTELQPFAGLPEMIAALSVPIAIATSSGREDVEHILRCTNLRQYFSAIITADDVQQHKPDPQPYLDAAALISVAPEGCIVIEDSPAGVASGIAAGCTVLAVTSSHPAEKLSAAPHIFSTTTEALAWAWP